MLLLGYILALPLALECLAAPQVRLDGTTIIGRAIDFFGGQQEFFGGE